MTKPIIVSKEDFDSGNYPKGVPIMVGMTAGLNGKSSMGVGRKKITIRMKAA